MNYAEQKSAVAARLADRAAEWMTVERAAAVMAVSEESIIRRLRSGVIVGKKLHAHLSCPPKCHCPWAVSSSSIGEQLSSPSAVGAVLTAPTVSIQGTLPVELSPEMASNISKLVASPVAKHPARPRRRARAAGVDSPLSRKVGATLREVRTSKGYSQKALAIGCGVATNTVSRWETGTYPIPIDALEQASTILHVPVATFFGEDPDAFIASQALAAMNRFARELGLPAVTYARPTRRKS